MRVVYKIAVMLLLPLMSRAQQYEEVTWDQTFRESGKIYIVVAVVLLILLTVLGYLVTQDRRIGRLEKELKENKS